MRRWFSLTRNERHLVISAAASVIAAIAGLHIAGVRRMMKWADRPMSAESAARMEQIDEFVVAVERAGRYVPGGTCLAQSLALARMLRKRGIAADVRVGVRTDDGFHAHAWVEVKGVAITRESGHKALTHRTNLIPGP